MIDEQTKRCTVYKAWNPLSRFWWRQASGGLAARLRSNRGDIPRGTGGDKEKGDRRPQPRHRPNRSSGFPALGYKASVLPIYNLDHVIWQPVAAPIASWFTNNMHYRTVPLTLLKFDATNMQKAKDPIK
jgi:hypothetical protein